MPTRFEWDPAKATANLRKHAISFDIALRAFADSFALSHLTSIENGEFRWQTLGVVEGYLLLLVAHTIHEELEGSQSVEVIRIISARTADRKERKRYEQETR
jgi:uncharacterized protein